MPRDPRTFKAPRLSKHKICAAADKFRKDHSLNAIPINVLGFIEFELQLEIVPIPNLRTGYDIDAFLYGDWRRIGLDQQSYLSPVMENRLRFSVAHELGHYVLHRGLLDKYYTTPDEWIRFFKGIPEEQYNWIEYHANEFAGRLLVPVDHLKAQFSSAMDRINQIRDSTQKDFTLESVSREIGRKFGVSEQVIIKRLKSEQLFEIV